MRRGNYSSGRVLLAGVTASIAGLLVGCAGISGTYTVGRGDDQVVISADGEGRVTVGGESAGGPWGFAVDLAELVKQWGQVADAAE